MGFEKQKPLPTELWTVESMMLLDPAVKWTAVGLRAYADDQGRQTRTDWTLRRALYPRDELSREEFDSHLLQLAIADVIVLYEVNGTEYYAMVSMPAGQHPKPSMFPPPPEGIKTSSRQLQDDVLAWEREGEREGGGVGASESDASRNAPSPFCPAHQPTLGTDENCRACGRRRLALDEYWRQHRELRPSAPTTGHAG